MDGGSGIICYNWLTTAAPADGTVIAVGSQPATNAIVNADPACQFDALDFNYLGTIQEDYFCISANPDSPYADIDYLKNCSSVVMASTAVNDAHTYAGVAALECLGIPDSKIIGGYGSVNAGALAMEQGEVNLNASGNITALKNENEVPLFTFAEKRDPSLPDVPTVYEVFPDMNDECRNLMASLPRNIKIILTNKDVPDDRVEFLAYCVDQMFEDPQFAEDLKAQTGLDFTGGQNAEETTKVAQNYVDHRDDYGKWSEYVSKYIIN
jgi:tripartite-type tricarboxylate transporter receptor subunit TctC